MTVTKVLVDIPVHDALLARLRSMPGIEVELSGPSRDPRELPVEQARDVNILMCVYPPTNVVDMASLELVQIVSVGYAQLYGLGLVERGIRACNARGVFDSTISEWNIAMMINLARDLRGMIRNQEAGLWDRDARFQREVRGLTVGLWGYGGIGRETARLAKTMGLTVHVLSRNGVGPRADVYQVAGTGDRDGRLPDRVFVRGQEEEFLRGLDFLILSMPLTPTTNGLLGERELRWLPSHAWLLNPARGPLVKEEALLKALRDGWIAGAALDTHYHYPMPPEHPLWKFPNVIMTPHISGTDESQRFKERIWDLFTQNVERYLAGKPLLNELTPAELNGA